MEEYFKFHNINDLENMLINIQNEGKNVIWELIEKEKNPLKRCYQRKLYSQALNKIIKEK